MPEMFRHSTEVTPDMVLPIKNLLKNPRAVCALRACCLAEEKLSYADVARFAYHRGFFKPHDHERIKYDSLWEWGSDTVNRSKLVEDELIIPLGLPKKGSVSGFRPTELGRRVLRALDTIDLRYLDDLYSNT